MISLHTVEQFVEDMTQFSIFQTHWEFLISSFQLTQHLFHLNQKLSNIPFIKQKPCIIFEVMTTRIPIKKKIVGKINYVSSWCFPLFMEYL